MLRRFHLYDFKKYSVEIVKGVCDFKDESKEKDGIYAVLVIYAVIICYSYS